MTDEDGTRFYPSRFIGYKKNSMGLHDSNDYKDGRETTPCISSIINNGKAPEHDALLEELFIEYYAFLGFTAREKGSYGVQRKYWRLEITRIVE